MLSLNRTFVIDVIYLNWVFLKCPVTKVSNIEKIDVEKIEETLKRNT